MFAQKFRAAVERSLARAGIEVGGPRPWDITVNNESFYRRVALGGSLGLGESYVDGCWDCQRLDGFFSRVLQAGLDAKHLTVAGGTNLLRAILVNLQKASRAFEIGERHYNIGNDLFSSMLDRRMIYSCAYWQGARSLDEAQEAKLALACGKIGLREGMSLLDVGCGWGGAARFAASRYGATVTGITVSRRQQSYAQQVCRGLPVEIRFEDYRATRGRFDRIVSIGMFEHVGRKNYRTYMEKMRGLLKRDGLFLLQTIGGNRSTTCTDPWIEKYIFPNSMLPSPSQLCAAVEGIFLIEDWHCFGADYDRTLMSWHENFSRSWDLLKKTYDERFYRLWSYYLLSCAGAFRARATQLWQIVLSPQGAYRTQCRPPAAGAGTLSDAA